MEISLENMKISDLDNINLENFDNFWNKNILREELTNSSSHYIIAKYENHILGFAGIKFLLNEAHITNIATRIDKRNHRHSVQNF